MYATDEDERIARMLDAGLHYRRAEWLAMGGGLFLMNALCAVFVNAAPGWLVLWIICAALLLGGAGWCVYHARQLIQFPKGAP